ncbi:MAG: tRNA preQ1(34) S-adenosylmethionine ribosyltransferase-isomerase QueA [Oscillospiraceae bacterium]|nr:tRNA preQ1(34) S-adenosylmethionine ribosyltransferase-isomerase QueA [Oscillospiraceae bacterium]
MLKSDFYYELPEELIAQTPIEPRDASRLMVINRVSGEIKHDYFYNIADYLDKGDLLVMNDSKVLPARLYPTNYEAEVLLLEQKELGDNTCLWECIGRNLKQGRVFEFVDEGKKIMSGEVIEILPNANRLIRFSYEGDFFGILDIIGNMPLPPYITEKLTDKSRYNTVYAKDDKAGSAAAPTAGLHFTNRVFANLESKGVDTAWLTLHVGIGTFRPVKVDKIEEHEMHSERYFVPDDTAKKIADCKARGNRVVAVGTTSCRTLEAIGASGKGVTEATSGSTDIFITPGFRFKVMDSLITNFHLPESTLLMLISAVMTREKALVAYEEAIKERYRFFSFGDSMLIL